MAEYIEREAIHTGLNEFYFTGIMSLRSTIDNLPAADVRPVRVGKLEKHGAAIRCSVCGFDTQSWDVSFCPNCGAEMEES